MTDEQHHEEALLDLRTVVASHEATIGRQAQQLARHEAALMALRESHRMATRLLEAQRAAYRAALIQAGVDPDGVLEEAGLAGMGALLETEEG